MASSNPCSFPVAGVARAGLLCLGVGIGSTGCGLGELDGLTGGAGGTTPSGRQALPLVVDQFFVAASWGAGLNGNATMTPSLSSAAKDCTGDRPPNARGDCHSVTYASFPNGDPGGFAWLYPANNTGTLPGLLVAPGAQHIRFFARGAVGGEVVGFEAGGIGFFGNQPIRDGFAIAPQNVTLTTEWQKYSLDLAGKDYSTGLLGAFGWQLLPSSNTAPVKFFIDDLVYE